MGAAIVCAARVTSLFAQNASFMKVAQQLPTCQELQPQWYETLARREDDWNVTNVADDSHGIDSSWHVILDVRCRGVDEVDVGIQSTVSRNSTQPGNPGLQRNELHGIG